jgi:hypothetical protein
MNYLCRDHDASTWPAANVLFSPALVPETVDANAWSELRVQEPKPD